MSNMLKVVISASFLALAAPTTAAIAVHVEAGGPHPVSFDIARQPAPVSFVSGSSFVLDGVHGIFDGVSGTRSITFFNNSLAGGFEVAGGPGIFSQQAYIHDESAPFIEVGDYSAQDRATGSSTGLLIYESGTIGGVPEPTAWVLMIGGFGIIGSMQRTRRHVAV